MYFLASLKGTCGLVGSDCSNDELINSARTLIESIVNNDYQ